MTGRELIMWILEREAYDAQIEVQYRDSGGYYNGTDKTPYMIEEIVSDDDGWTYKRIVL